MRSRFPLLDISSLLFILLWGYTAISKVMEFDQTQVQLSQSPMIGSWAKIFAVALPVVELGLVMLLLMERTKRIAVLLSLALMTAFTTYILIMLRFSYHIPCACAGIFSHGVKLNGEVIFKMSWTQHVYFNLVFVYLGLANILWPSTGPAPALSSTPKLQGA